MADTIRLTWTDRATTEEGYYVYRSTNSAHLDAAALLASGATYRIASLAADVATYDDTGFTADTFNYYRVAAYQGSVQRFNVVLDDEPILGVSSIPVSTAADVLALSPSFWYDPRAADVYSDAGTTYMTGGGDDGTDVVQWNHRATGSSAVNLSGFAGSLAKWYSAGENDQPYLDFYKETTGGYSGKTIRRMFGSPTEELSPPLTMYWVLASHVVGFTGGCHFEGNPGEEVGTYHTGGYVSALSTNMGTDGYLYWNNYLTTDTRIYQLRVAGDALPTFRINGGSLESVYAGGSTNPVDEVIFGTGTNNLQLFKYGTLPAKLYQWLVVPNITHDQDVVFSYLGDKYGITVDAVS